jgi:hypothetical protein
MDDTRMNFWTSLAVVATAILLLVFFLWLLDQFIESDFALALLGFAGAIATASFQYRAVKDRETAARLFSEKQKVYTELTETIRTSFIVRETLRGA